MCLILRQTSIVFRRQLFSGIRLAIVRSYIISMKENFQYLLIVAVLSVANMLGGGRQLLVAGHWMELGTRSDGMLFLQ